MKENIESKNIGNRKFIIYPVPEVPVPGIKKSCNYFM